MPFTLIGLIFFTDPFTMSPRLFVKVLVQQLSMAISTESESYPSVRGDGVVEVTRALIVGNRSAMELIVGNRFHKG